MLYALARPASLAVLLICFVVGVTLHGWVQAQVAARYGDRRPAAERRTEPDPRRHLDPFGTVAVALSGLGWARPVELLDRRHRAAVLAVTLSGPLANLVLGAALLLGWRLAYGPGVMPDGPTLLREGTLEGWRPEVALALAGVSQLFLGALSLVPLPPLDGGRLLFALAPRTVGWQKAERLLVEQNAGIVAVLVLVILPLGGGVALLPEVCQTVLRPLIDLLTGA